MGPAGVNLKAFLAGVDELVIGEGKDQRNVKESFGPAPMLTAFLKSDLNIGTLIVSTGEDDVRVFVNEKEYRRKTQRGQVRIPAIGKVNVRVVKDGFLPVVAQTAEVKKGAEVRLEFKMNAAPVVSTLANSRSESGRRCFDRRRQHRDGRRRRDVHQLECDSGRSRDRASARSIPA